MRVILFSLMLVLSALSALAQDDPMSAYPKGPGGNSVQDILSQLETLLDACVSHRNLL